MKTKFYLLAVILLLSWSHVDAQTPSPKNKYLNFSYASSTLQYKDTNFSMDSDYGAAITVGRTFYLNKKPIANMIRFGIDWTYFDLNFAGYSENIYYEDDEEEKMNLYQAEAGMHIGPSVTVTPINGLNISAYLRYAPSFAAIYDDYFEEFKGNFGSFFVTGVSASYKVISLGIEYRWGSSSYNFDLEDDDYESYSYKQTVKTSGPRFYLGFRF